MRRLHWMSCRDIYTIEQMQSFGFKEQAERWNGRLAMLGFVIGLLTEIFTGQGVIAQLRILLPGS